MIETMVEIGRRGGKVGGAQGKGPGKCYGCRLRSAKQRPRPVPKDSGFDVPALDRVGVDGGQLGRFTPGASWPAQRAVDAERDGDVGGGPPRRSRATVYRRAVRSESAPRSLRQCGAAAPKRASRVQRANRLTGASYST